MCQRFEVRVKGDNEFDYFIENSVENGEVNYDPKNYLSAMNYADEVGGWVVEILERVVYINRTKEKT